MFGRQDKDNDQLAATDSTDTDAKAVVHPTPTDENTPVDWQHPGTPLDTPADDKAEEPAAEADKPAVEDVPQAEDTPEPESAPEVEEASTDDVPEPVGADEQVEDFSAGESQKADEPATPTAAPIVDVSGPAGDFSPPVDSSANNEDLIDIKQKALSDLAPLVDHLDQTPEDKFRTTMMVIQASDDQTLVKRAFEAAENIQDEKAKAQALLDIVNEINYFTQPHDQ